MNKSLSKHLSKADRIALNKRVLAKINDFCDEVAPDGMLSPEGEYWYDRNGKFKISLSTGGLWNLKTPGVRNPFGDPLMTWIKIKELQNDFPKAVKTLTRWIEEKERAKPASPVIPDIVERYRILKEKVNRSLDTEIRKDSAKNIRRSVRAKVGEAECNRFTELRFAKNFRDLLHYWAVTEDEEWFLVRETWNSRNKCIEYTLTKSRV